jgi:hypothetical protein
LGSKLKKKNNLNQGNAPAIQQAQQQSSQFNYKKMISGAGNSSNVNP